jgi:hypothetical protein
MGVLSPLHGRPPFLADLPVAKMEDWDFTQGFYFGLSQEAKEHIDNLAGGTFFLLKT